MIGLENSRNSLFLRLGLTIDGYIDEKEVFKIVIESLKYGGKVCKFSCIKILS